MKANLIKTKVTVSGSKEEILKSKVDPCANCGQEGEEKFSAGYKM